ncbi:UDP-N-acetylmuramoyl-L-alanine--D-glutamate ligase [Methylacidiphilum sp. Yel]|uniref:UDP-N-acetylmuramoyl-L-alanine--D-glutamate ligase n=1 Tax=Methylacidiphilum sp. Yel TaxID=1847730 RepID=UPI001FC93066|nr:UDP-N-acetylmuramoyl-L-alanine--D-glutamate ligase [Methylacidiphilum sp. Yel]
MKNVREKSFLMTEAIRSYFLGKKILIWGLGLEGMATLEFLLTNLPGTFFFVSDSNPATLKAIHSPWIRQIEENDLFSCMENFDVIVKSPGIRTSHLAIEPSIKEKIVLQTDLFLHFWPGITIGITGSKGKSTTTSLIHHLLKKNGLEAYIGGNIGVPPFHLIPFASEKAIAVLELSSYQLEYCQHSPSIAIWLNLYQEHLNYHGSFEAYSRAKSNIARFQSSENFFLYNADNPSLSEFLASFDPLPGKLIAIDEKWKETFDCSRLKLPGEHNKRNALFAALTASLFGISAEKIAEAFASFCGLPHRLEYVATIEGISYYNDSIATVPEATLAGIEAIANVQSLIIGGQDRGLPLEDFASKLCQTINLRNIILLPETGWRIGTFFERKNHKKNLFFAKDLEEAVIIASKFTAKGSSCLFSPAAPSYHRYLNFEKRGEHFKRLVLQLQNV